MTEAQRLRRAERLAARVAELREGSDGPAQRDEAASDAAPDTGRQAPPSLPQKPKRPVRKPASPVRVRGRHYAVLASLFIFVMLPSALVGWYLWNRAADQYASSMGFSVRKEETGSAVELLGGITQLSGSSSSDTDILYKFLQSQELVARIDEQVDLRTIWSKVDAGRDPVFAYSPPGTIEDLLEQWEKMVKIYYDSSTGLIDLRVLAFDPRDAQRIAQAINTESSEMINQLSAIAREDAIRYAREELATSVQRLKEARQALTAFRNRTQIVDPTIDTQGQMGLLNTLQVQLAEALIDLDLLKETTRESDPRIEAATRKIRVIETRIEAERQKLGIGTSDGQGQVFADLVGEYEGLIVDREFAEQAYTSSLAAYDSSLAEARRQSRYLAAHVRPTLAEQSEYPKRGLLLFLSGLFLFLMWAVVVLVSYSLRDRR